MNECCKHQCRLCSRHFGLTAMRTHTRRNHGMSVREYQAQHGKLRENMSMITWHKCQLCKEELLLDTDEIHNHANIKHRMSQKEYNSRFLILKNNTTDKSIDAAPAVKTEVNEEIPFEEAGDEFGFMNL